MRANLRRVRNDAIKAALFFIHEAALRAGLIVLPRHYYVPVADLRELRRTRDVWARRSCLAGLEFDLDAQARRLERMVTPWRREYADNRVYDDTVAAGAGPGYGPIEAQCLHAMVRALKPGRVVEVGSGVSTAVILAADDLNRRDGDHGAEIVCIEPQPRPWLRAEPRVRLLDKQVQRVPPEFFDALGPGDILFIDSSHTVRPGGDVPFLVLDLEVLPRLSPGVVVHLHDIYLPYDYQRDVERALFQWQETALLHAFLIGNRGVEILLALSALHYDRPDALRAAFPAYRPQADQDGLSAPEADGHFPSSLWLRAVRAPRASRPARPPRGRTTPPRAARERRGE